MDDSSDRLDEADPRRWLGDTPVLNLRDDKLRLRVKTVTQFSRNDAEKLKCICNYVASIPFNVPAFAGIRKTRKTLTHRPAVGWYSKAGLFLAMLRVAGFPARIRMFQVEPGFFQGMAKTRQQFVLPVVEIWIREKWVITDNYVYDPPYLATALEAVSRRGWRAGFGVHLDGQTTWNGIDDALIMFVPDRSKGPTPSQYLGVYDDPLEYLRQLKQASLSGWIWALMRNRIMSIRLNRKVRQLRVEAGG
ncbi:MAG TPA: transglutaminase-like domain-containing protein [Polaromonas sp.]|uniref:transglutaminase-like domain-containing protein n=1 Tax=Polaromonas sp. TaxID=1869339 RepID=UPI002D35C681|nr:transglutaminase-like domain-containing protein [Polaromonas sp.]HYW58777.1 transglutaminase-like domain-containing protein [Polaromonas sp.]